MGTILCSDNYNETPAQNRGFLFLIWIVFKGLVYFINIEQVSSFEACLYNTDMSTYSLQRRSSRTILEENILCILVHDAKGGSEITDPLKIVLSSEQRVLTVAFGS